MENITIIYAKFPAFFHVQLLIVIGAQILSFIYEVNTVEACMGFQAVAYFFKK